MARIGLTNFRYSPITDFDENGTPIYSGAKTPGKAVSCNVSITNNDASLYADDSLAESDTSFQSGTVTMGVDDEDLQTQADLLGHTYDSENNALICNVNDTAPYVGLGRVVTKIVGGVRKYKAEVLSKVKFSEPSQDDTTKGESVEFATTEIEGNISTPPNGIWRAAAIFDTQEEAIEFIENGFAAPVSA